MSTATPTIQRPTGTAATPSLKKAALGLLDDLVIAVSSTAPAYSIATSLAALAVVVALGAPAAVWVGFFPVMGIAVAYYYLNRADPNCGASYTWVGKSIHPTMGFVTGWVQILASLLFMSYAAPQAGQATLQLLNVAGLHSIGPLSLSATDPAGQGTVVAVGIAWLALVTYMVMVGIRVAARFQYLLLALEYFIVVGFAILGIFKGGGTAFSFDWLNPLKFGSLTALAGGVVVAVFFYWGWDTAANLNEETTGSSENPGRAGMLGMVALLFIFLLAVISIQMVLTPDEIQANASTTLTFFANKLVGQPLASLAILAFLSSTVATVQTTLLPSARTAFSMGRDGVLGRVWASVHPKWETPWLGTLILAVVAAAVAVLSLPVGGMSQIVIAGVTAIGILVAFYYGMAGIACAIYYRRALRHSLKGFIFAGLFPVLSAIALFVLAGYLIYQNWTSTDSITFNATNGRFVVIVPVLVILTAIPAMIWSMLRARSNYYGLPREAADARALQATSAGSRS